MRKLLFLFAAVVGLIAGSSVVNADVILSTDFSGTTENGFVLEDVTYTTLGVTVPASESDLTVNNTTLANGDGTLFTTAAADGFFAVNNNTGNGGEWNVPINFTTDSDDIELTSLDFLYQNFNGNGGFQSAIRRSFVTVSLVDTANGHYCLD